MTISWYGQSCFKIDSRDVTIAVDPYEKTIGLTPPRFRADLVLITHAHPDHSNREAIPGSPFIVEGPGEYEIKGVSIVGVQTFHDASSGKERGTNTAYVIEAEGIRLCHLGDFGEEKPREETLEALGDIDILLVPVGGVYTVDAKLAARVVGAIEPRIVVPMHYKIPRLAISLETADAFLKELGAGGEESVEKLVIKKKDLPDEEMKVVVLKPS